MKLITLLLAALPILAYGKAKVSVNDKLSIEETQQVLNSLDAICGDTWCGGDLDFRFTKLSCPEGAWSCDLTLTAQVWGYEGYNFPVENFQCRLGGFSKREDIVEEGPYAARQHRNFKTASPIVFALMSNHTCIL